jgi:hypothetical protein
VSTVRCETCGAPLDRAGEGHFCRPGREAPNDLAATFTLAGRRVVRFSVAYALIVVLASLLGLAGYTAIRSGAADPAAVGTQASVLIGGAVAGLVSLVCVVGLLISAVVWLVSAHRLLDAGPGLAGYGGLAACAVLIALAYALPTRMATVGAAGATEAALRIGGVALLIAGVLRVRARARRETGLPLPSGKPPALTSDDWDASRWDPEVHRDIERRRKPNP